MSDWITYDPEDVDTFPPRDVWVEMLDYLDEIVLWRRLSRAPDIRDPTLIGEKWAKERVWAWYFPGKGRWRRVAS